MVVVVVLVGSLSQNSSRNFGKSMYSQSTATKHPFRLRSVIFQTIKFEIEFVELDFGLTSYHLFQFVLFPCLHRPTLRFIFSLKVIPFEFRLPTVEMKKSMKSFLFDPLESVEYSAPNKRITKHSTINSISICC